MSDRRNLIWKFGIAGFLGVLGVLSFGGWGASAEDTPQQAQPARQQSQLPQQDYSDLVTRALQDDAQVSERAIQDLRRIGPDAVTYLMSKPELRQLPRWQLVLDAVAQQKDARFSGLYWHTDLNQALQVAKREQKPVLSLRLLGKLTDELSCANSRYFRTTLYPNTEVRNLLAEKFVLHWQTVRSVPIITIEFGDGRQIKRTITGNSLHLVLDHQGRSIDVLPGLYGPGVFVRELQSSGPAAVQMAQLEGDAFQQQRRIYHDARQRELLARWESDCAKAKITSPLQVGVDQDTATWTKLAALYFVESYPKDGARQAIEAKAPPVAELAATLTITKSIAETPMMRQLRNVTNSINLDTVRNEYLFHAQIHNWFNHPLAHHEREQLVGRVYSELFLSPLNDPWYGLSKPDVYSAITNDGRVHAVTQNAGH